MSRKSLLRKTKDFLGQSDFLRDQYANARYLTHSLRDGLMWSVFGGASGAEADTRQALLEWKLEWPAFKTPEELVAWFTSRGLKVDQGFYTIYLPPQPKLADILPEVTKFYPPGCGFKILKDFRHPDQAHYLSGAAQPAARAKLMGAPKEQIVSANYLHTAGVGPQIWDLACWKSGTTSLTVFVVEHIEGAPPSDSECKDFLAKVKKLISTAFLRITFPNWESTKDFACPGCNGNLLKHSKSGQLHYIDFQNFRVSDTMKWREDIVERGTEIFHFGGGRPIRGRKYLYQAIPGFKQGAKRNTTKRWVFLINKLKEGGVDLRNRLVFDIGCNSGMILNSALHSGAKWGLGWDRIKVVPFTREILHSLGTTRFCITGGELGESYPLIKDIPPHLEPLLSESVIFYLSVRQHIGLLKDLEKIPWRAFIYEGHQGESEAEMPAILAPILKNGAKIFHSTSFSDGDSTPRPLAILIRDSK